MDGLQMRVVPIRFAFPALLALACSGCAMLGELFDTAGLRIVVLVVIAVAAVGFLASRANRR
jgi:hypothetical protein